MMPTWSVATSKSGRHIPLRSDSLLAFKEGHTRHDVETEEVEIADVYR